MIIQLSEGHPAGRVRPQGSLEDICATCTILFLENCTALFHPVNPWDSMARHASAFPAHVGWVHSIYGIIAA